MASRSGFSFVFGTNMWNHYQAALAEELVRLHGAQNVRMALFQPVPEERLRLGWAASDTREWLIGPPTNDSERAALREACVAADVMLFGECDWEVLSARTRLGKLTLVASERLLKQRGHRLRLLNPRYALGFARYRRRVAHDNIHALTIGHHAPTDLKTLRAFGDRMWRWGYFPRIPAEPLGPRPPGSLRVLWAGRFLRWKRVDTLVRAVALVQDEPWFGSATLIGGGPDLRRIERIAHRVGLREDKLRFLPPVPPSDVRGWMRESDVFVLPSDRGEGWGVVANEAMAEGCVFVGNEEAGASRELVEHGRTGFLFPNGDARALAAILARIGRYPDVAAAVRVSGRAHIAGNWSPEVAASRVLHLAEGLLRGAPPSFADGPCARPMFEAR